GGLGGAAGRGAGGRPGPGQRAARRLISAPFGAPVGALLPNSGKKAPGAHIAARADNPRVATTSIQVSLGDVVATLALVAVAVAVSFWRRADLEEDIGIAVVRSFVQLTAIGYVINFIFDQ